MKFVYKFLKFLLFVLNHSPFGGTSWYSILEIELEIYIWRENFWKIVIKNSVKIWNIFRKKCKIDLILFVSSLWSFWHKNFETRKLYTFKVWVFWKWNSKKVWCIIGSFGSRWDFSVRKSCPKRALNYINFYIRSYILRL